MSFEDAFKVLTGNAPFPWQIALYGKFMQGEFPATACLPTGLGKTSIIAAWLIALGNRGKDVPRRLVYVVNRRTVVDQTTDEVRRYRDRLANDSALFEIANRLRSLCAFDPGESPLAISTLRGQFADNREWSTDPARPAVICGTVDMIGSRLLFNGYGVGWKARPLHAGFLAQDTLLIHDEAHLELPFQKLIEEIEAEQEMREPQRRRDRGSADVPWKGLRVVELTATPRGRDNSAPTTDVFTLQPEDHAHPVVQQRVSAVKKLQLAPLKESKKPGPELAEHALKFTESGAAILVFARTIDDVMTVRDKLNKAKCACEVLTGTMRGRERDDLVRKPTFQRFLPPSSRDKNIETATGTVYLVCTSAGEVGVNLSADHLVCDLSPFDSMAQRFGRVNRFGQRDDSTITVLHPLTFDDKDPLTDARERTLGLLRRLDGNASPKALAEKLTDEERIAGFTPPPVTLPVTDILFDAWSLTSIRDKLPGRPPVEPFLHGLAEWEPPQTQVAWREEVEVLDKRDKSDQLLIERLKLDPADLLDDYPLKPHELLQDRSDRVLARLKEFPRANDAPRTPVWIVANDNTVTVTTIGQLLFSEKKVAEAQISGATLLLSPLLGGLDKGVLTPGFPEADDVSDEWYVDKERTQKRRVRVWDDDPLATKLNGMRLIRTIDSRPDADEIDEETQEDESISSTPNGRYWKWYTLPASADDDRSKTCLAPITWQDHTNDVTNNAEKKIAQALLVSDPGLKSALILAAKFHDLGKRRVVWQRSIGNPRAAERDWYAKSGLDPATGKSWRPFEVSDYRHEFGSLVDVLLPNQNPHEALDEPLLQEFRSLPEEMHDVVLHLIAAHHGWARPHFDVEHAFDPERGDVDGIASEIPRRFARLQRRYGRWGLAYLESLLRAADWAASADKAPSKDSPAPPAEETTP